MKKSLMLLGCLLGFLVVFGQQSSSSSQAIKKDVIKLPPKIGQGYLVMHDLKDVTRWEVEVIEKKITPQNTIKEQVVEQATLSNGVNYYRVKDKYLKDGSDERTYITNITGYSNTNEIIVETGSAVMKKDSIDFANCFVNPTGWGQGLNPLCSWVCDGKTPPQKPPRFYSWELTLYDPPNDAPFLELRKTFNYVDTSNNTSIPYYSYVTRSVAETWCQNQGYGTLPTCYYFLGGLYLLKPDDLPDGRDFCDADGNVINNPYGVAKDDMMWKSGMQAELASAGSKCIFTKQGIINLFNTVNNSPLLDSIPLKCIDYPRCASTTPPSGVTWEPFGCPPGEFMNAKGECVPMDSMGPATVTIRDINTNVPITSNGPRVLRFSTSDVLTDKEADNKTKHNYRTITLEPSLYLFTIASSDTDVAGLSHVPVIKEVKQPLSFKMEVDESKREERLIVDVFPNPVKDNWMGLKMKADTDMKVDFSLKDFNGNVVHTDQFDLQKNQERTETIQPQNGIPQGLLICEFTLPGGDKVVERVVKI